MLYGSKVEGRGKGLFVSWFGKTLTLPPLLTLCKSLLSLQQFYYFLHNYWVLPCSEQSPVRKYCTTNYKDAWRRAEPDQMGCSQAAYDSPRQKLAQSPRGRSSDAAKHDTVVFFVFFFPFSFFFLFFRSWQRHRCSSSTWSEAAIAARIKCFGLQLCLPLWFLFPSSSLF